MLERESSVIVTDQNACMKSAIATIFPLSQHTFCMWHITVKLQAKSIKAVIWGEYKDCQEFEVAWCELINKYDLHANKWLADMYNIRSSWIPVYIGDVNMGALLRTTSRSESENSFFGRYSGRFMTLMEFFMGFNSAMDLERENRVHLDRESRCSVPTLNSTLNLEKHASETFSYPVFKKIHFEMSDSAYGCAIQSFYDSEIGRVYIINDALRNNKLFQVTFTENGGSLNCSCMMLESCGYICRHLFKVMFFLSYDKIPDYMVTASGIQIQSGSTILEHASNGGVECSSLKAEYFTSTLQMPPPADVVVNNPGMSRNKWCGKRI
ncbi:hypothetical protein QQ045_009967 [Rhodiola kirilowii]